MYGPPSRYMVNLLREEMKKYKKDYVDENCKTVTHTYNSPYPPLGNVEIQNPRKFNINTEISYTENVRNMNIEIQMEHLTCFLNKKKFTY